MEEQNIENVATSEENDKAIEVVKAAAQDLFERDMEELESSPYREFHTIERMDYDLVDDVFAALNYAFHPNGFDNDEPIDPRMISIWNVFLATVGWNEDEFWEVSANEREHDETCTACLEKEAAEKVESNKEIN